MSKRFSILVGINDYPNLRELSFCEKDAEDISVAFHNFCNVKEGNLKLVTSTTKKPVSDPWAEFCSIIETFKSEFLAGIDDIFFYFAGHGLKADQTTIVFKKENKSIFEIMSKLDELHPRSKVLFFDSCHSGAGLEDIERSAIELIQAEKSSTGYSILCAASIDQKSKESTTMGNGRFTGFLIKILADLQSYNKDAYLDINTIFSKINAFFVDNPSYEQNPFLQIKSLGSYPLATALKEQYLYKRFDYCGQEDFDWDEFILALNTYLKTSAKIKGEFLRLMRELLNNGLDPSKGNAKNQSIEITKNRVLICEDGNFFDLFNPPEGIIGRGGIITAKKFNRDFGDKFSYKAQCIDGLNTYEFIFNELSDKEICTLYVSFNVMKPYLTKEIVIDGSCTEYRIRFVEYGIYVSFAYMFMEKLKNEAERFGKKIIFELLEGDWIVEHVQSAIKMYEADEWISVEFYNE
ncbi:caspase family protein [Mucilaginibacter sp. RB4R14]|uniref:caspase family protein n=1 Tax=Mucilaginibacter aurantiaciroseus TaxID=2949308 RepID=UPI0020902326|nr:caspase family protein [Mucilaginibacter aurantiaciroseus]MCO5936902.1 caspase family protein [Mucilaginibacter aurantiaciroseus]